MACLAIGVGAVFGAGLLADNSFLTHLATGRLIWDGKGIPHSDPYTFTAAGRSWLVQSWLASVLYGGIEKAAGLGAIRVLMAATTGLLGWFTWALTRRGATVPGRLVVFVPAFLAGAFSWPHRPLLLGLVALGVTMVVAEGRADPRWLLPIGWFWVNVHGSWPLGLVALVTIAAGQRLDGVAPTLELRALRWLAAGMLAGAINPYGPKVLAFPVLLLSKRESLRGIVEWGPMNFSTVGQWAFLALLVVAVVAVKRAPSWRATVPLLVFAVAALTGLRNVPVAALVLAPGAAAGFAGLGSIRPADRGFAARALAVVGALSIALAAAVIVTTDDFDDEPYPVAATRWLRANDLDPRTHRIVAREFVGNWFEAVFGATGMVFIDDRIEVIPQEVVDDHRRLLRGAPDWPEILGRYEPDAVLWAADSALASELELSDDWVIGYRDADWVVAVRR